MSTRLFLIIGAAALVAACSDAALMGDAQKSTGRRTDDATGREPEVGPVLAQGETSDGGETTDTRSATTIQTATDDGGGDDSERSDGANDDANDGDDGASDDATASEVDTETATDTTTGTDGDGAPVCVTAQAGDAAAEALTRANMGTMIYTLNLHTLLYDDQAWELHPMVDTLPEFKAWAQRAIQQQDGSDFTFLDGWCREFGGFSADPETLDLTFASAGADGVFGTTDDIVATWHGLQAP